jgi:long-chain acyl-CoA synthetase
MAIQILPDLLKEALEKHPRPDCIAGKQHGKWVTYSTEDVFRKAQTVARALLHLGLKKGDRIALVSPNRPEWNFVDLGRRPLLALSPCPSTQTPSPKDYEYIINHAECRLLFCSGGEIYQKIQSILPNCPFRRKKSMSLIPRREPKPLRAFSL